eukprot:TRINITY_DN4390_c0_g1_i1.p1 TRINITY_DN4390_c0_g1~~TRINITY_DN4390_c0_g1_i1.p1  ORF type:complete len:389 (-),score=31.88 TRINITY_DN4390_c0_g1_i1:867-2033(-)
MAPRKRGAEPLSSLSSPPSQRHVALSVGPRSPSSPLSGSSSRKQKKTVPATVGKRLRRYVSSPSLKVKERIDRALVHRLFLIDCSQVQEEASGLSCHFTVLGATGNVYMTTVSREPSCTCPDAAKGNTCKHLLFVMMRVLRCQEDDPRIWQRALLSTEVTDLLSHLGGQGRGQGGNATGVTSPSSSQASGLSGNEAFQHGLPPDHHFGGSSVLASEGVRHAYRQLITGQVSSQVSTVGSDPGEVAHGEGRQAIGDQGAQRPLEGNCPICFELLTTSTDGSATEALVCCHTCRNSVHRLCFNRWKGARGASNGVVTCVYCRAEWTDGARRREKREEDGYVNLAEVSEHHRSADLSFEALYPDASSRMWWESGQPDASRRRLWEPRRYGR